MPTTEVQEQFNKSCKAVLTKSNLEIFNLINEGKLKEAQAGLVALSQSDFGKMLRLDSKEPIGDKFSLEQKNFRLVAERLFSVTSEKIQADFKNESLKSEPLKELKQLRESDFGKMMGFDQKKSEVKGLFDGIRRSFNLLRNLMDLEDYKKKVADSLRNIEKEREFIGNETIKETMNE